VLDRGIQEGGDSGGEAQAGELAEEIGEGLLEHIEGVGVVAREAAGEADHPVAVAIVERLEGRGIPAVDGLDEGGVVAGIVLAWTRAAAEFGAVLLFAGTFRLRAPNQFPGWAHLLGLNNADLLSLGMWLEIEGGRTGRGVAIGFVLLLLSALSVFAVTWVTRHDVRSTPRD